MVAAIGPDLNNTTGAKYDWLRNFFLARVTCIYIYFRGFREDINSLS